MQFLTFLGLWGGALGGVLFVTLFGEQVNLP